MSDATTSFPLPLNTPSVRDLPEPSGIPAAREGIPAMAEEPGLHFIRRSRRERPRVSLILLDWSVRESFHLLHYLSAQDLDRDQFEVIVVEYYSRVSDAVGKFEQQVDTWVLLQMPEQCYYHKHLMYNAGIVVARGDICVICDSDAMVKPGFIRAIIDAFDASPDIVLHIDQFRNIRRDLYPFAFPSFEDVTGRGCINRAGDLTSGLADESDPIHNRNFGACMCARRSDLIAIGGADEHIDFLGHVCGPYEMTFRLVNRGLSEVWHRHEFLYHTWHPGQAGADNYLGPHDGRQVSTTALDALTSGRVLPLLENPSIRRLREEGGSPSREEEFVIRTDYRSSWRHESLRVGKRWLQGSVRRDLWHGFVVEPLDDGFRAYPRVFGHPALASHREAFEVRGESLEIVRDRLHRALPWPVHVALPLAGAVTFFARALGMGYLFLRRRIARKLRR